MLSGFWGLRRFWRNCKSQEIFPNINFPESAEFTEKKQFLFCQGQLVSYVMFAQKNQSLNS
ncbi:MAG: hypothetical protein CMJ74_11660 [Planctomycetaceae bacterium]|nr:hypothetical protein [Planctomycetaceae bacterium]